MKKSSLILIIVVAVLAITALWSINIYNKLVNASESVENEWANVETTYQRRADLIPNLVSTVKGYAAHESATLESVVAARAAATQVKVDPENLTPEAIEKFQAAQGEMGNALGRLLMITENYPDLKANQNFLSLQESLEGTENRIQVARRSYNDVTKIYNSLVRRFPYNIISGSFGFEKMPYFEAEEGAQDAPKVEF